MLCIMYIMYVYYFYVSFVKGFGDYLLEGGGKRHLGNLIIVRQHVSPFYL